MEIDKQALSEVSKLLDRTAFTAGSRLRKAGNFAPFGMAIGPTGGNEELASAGEPAATAFERLVTVGGQGVRAKRWKAVAVAFSGRAVPPNGGERLDAIGIEVQHARLPARLFFVP
jgi:hypothetical protein